MRERRADRFAERPAIQNGHTGRCQAIGCTPACCRNPRDELVERRDLAAGKNIRPARRGRHFAAQPEALDQIVDVRQVIVDAAGAEDHESATRDAAKELEQPPIAGPVDARRPRDDDFDAGVGRRLRARCARLRAWSPDRRRPAGAAHPRWPADARRRHARPPCCSGRRAGRHCARRGVDQRAHGAGVDARYVSSRQPGFAIERRDVIDDVDVACRPLERRTVVRRIAARRASTPLSRKRPRPLVASPDAARADVVAATHQRARQMPAREAAWRR